jgi:hypothetical protein
VIYYPSLIGGFFMRLDEKLELAETLYDSDERVAETYDLIANFSFVLGMTVGVIIMLVYGAFK